MTVIATPSNPTLVDAILRNKRTTPSSFVTDAVLVAMFAGIRGDETPASPLPVKEA
jgi:hypothetical protein